MDENNVKLGFIHSSRHQNIQYEHIPRREDKSLITLKRIYGSNNSLISFYEWNKQEENMDVQMISAKSSSSSSKHHWTTSDGTKIESSLLFLYIKE